MLALSHNVVRRPCLEKEKVAGTMMEAEAGNEEETRREAEEEVEGETGTAAEDEVGLD